MKIQKLLLISILPILIASCRRGGGETSEVITTSGDVTSNTSSNVSSTTSEKPTSSESITSSNTSSGTSESINTQSSSASSSASSEVSSSASSSETTAPSASSSSQSSSASSSQSSSSSSSSPSSESTSETPETRVESISLNKKELILVKDKYEYLSVNFSPESTYTDEEKAGTWLSSDPSIATVSEYGKVTAIKNGTAVISYITTLGHFVGNCRVYVASSPDSIKKEWLKVDDFDSIASGDEIIFGCPEFGVTSSLDSKEDWLLVESATFSSDGSKLVSFGGNTASYYVSPGEDDSLTLENQNDQYLVGKSTTVGTKLNHIKSGKGQIDWIFERSGDFDYCVNYDIEDDYWLMFNKINASDIRFNLYDSNETAMMKLPKVYRLTITEIK